MEKRAEVRVEGIVQGVGFRPFCYRTAKNLGLKGWVRNTGDAGVKITLEGDKKSIKKFIETLQKRNPPLAQVDEVKLDLTDETSGMARFQILKSDKKKTGKSSVIPPDISLCEDCYREMMNPEDRRYHYPFITCVNCGPRFTIIEDVPYDRTRTSMKDFPLCKDCREEYEDPTDRRYHAEPNCCPENGPKMQLYGPEGTKKKSSEPIKRAAELLDEGKIVAIKGIGGIHISAKTTEDSPIKKLRKDFGRAQQPLAVMSRDLKTVRKFARVEEKEEKVLTSIRRPITLLKKKSESPLSNLIAPGLDSLGVMLPYSGIHHLLFLHGKEPAYVMTSANLPGLPMITENSEAISKLSGKVDYFLLHDRKIVNRCDDSVIRINDGKTAFLRRSRGYVPTPIKTGMENSPSVLALGADSDNTISISEGGKIFPSQYIGDLENLETIDYLKKTIQRFLKLLGIGKPEVVACDLHPDFTTTDMASTMAKEYGSDLVQIQHHKAHLYSLMAEQKIEELVGIVADGVGYGEDGTIWGGEVMVSNSGGFERVGGIKKYPLPGGDLAAKLPARSLAGILWNGNNSNEIEEILKEYCQDWLRENEPRVIIQQLQTGFNTPQASSTGRVLDAISCVLGICSKRTYEGEPAIKLEAAANAGNPDLVGLEIPLKKEGKREVIDARKLMLNIIEELEKGTERKHIAASAQKALAEGLSRISIRTAKRSEIKTVGVSGGVFYNGAITKSTKKMISGENLKFIAHEKVPPGDGGISTGQAFSMMKKSLLKN